MMIVKTKHKPLEVYWPCLAIKLSLIAVLKPMAFPNPQISLTVTTKEKSQNLEGNLNVTYNGFIGLLAQMTAPSVIVAF